MNKKKDTNPWGDAERSIWLSNQKIKRSYPDQVISKFEILQERFILEQYGALSCDPNRYPLFALISRKWKQERQTILITGGVHGYETSGVQGAIRFLQENAPDYLADFNILALPCISPWGYETINRWNPYTLDPNRSFFECTASEEAGKAMDVVRSMEANILAHFDLHETTDTDKTEFRPALAARDGTAMDNFEIPDGFYTVGNTKNPQDAFQRAIIQSVENVTHIAPADEQGRIIGEQLSQKGVINYPVKKLALCTGFTEAQFVTTTEVYPDSATVNDENCIAAQVAAVVGGLDFLLNN